MAQPGTRSSRTAAPHRARARGPVVFLLPAGLALLGGLDAAVQLLGLPAPVSAARLPRVHGMLLVLGFGGTLISLERAVALRRRAALVAPALLGSGGLLCPGRAGPDRGTEPAVAQHRAGHRCRRRPAVAAGGRAAARPHAAVPGRLAGGARRRAAHGADRGPAPVHGWCLLAGYGWLAVAGATWLLGGPAFDGERYDAVVHAVFLGFTLSMIMAHAPVILPAVLHRPLPYHPAMWAPVGLLHASLVLRVWVGDALGVHVAWQAGGALNVAAVLLFVVVAVWSATRRPAGVPV